MSSMRQQIVDAMKARLATITKANGYQTDAGKSVFVWRKNPVTPAETPCMLLEDGKLVRDYGQLIGLAKNKLSGAILSVVKGGITDVQARQIEADIYACLGDWNSAGGLADEVLVVDSDLIMEQFSEMVAGVQATVEIEYTTPRNRC